MRAMLRSLNRTIALPPFSGSPEAGVFGEQSRAALLVVEGRDDILAPPQSNSGNSLN